MMPTCSGNWSACPRICSTCSREEPVQEPARRSIGPVEPGAEEPEAPPRLVLDVVVVAQLLGRRGAPPPLAADALRPVGAAHAMLPATPAEEERRIVRHRRHRLDRLGPRQQA